jgi:gamma-carbonic anhydrase
VVRDRQDHPTRIGRHTAVGPHAHVNGAVCGEAVFLATGASVFPGARIGAGAEVRINGVVHVNSVLADAAVVPIGWVAPGDPAQILRRTSTRPSGRSSGSWTSWALRDRLGSAR